jgi:hypothetical protein
MDAPLKVVSVGEVVSAAMLQKLSYSQIWETAAVG